GSQDLEQSAPHPFIEAWPYRARASRPLPEGAGNNRLKGALNLSTQERSAATRVVVASTVMLSFISFWRGAAIVLSDLASSAFYAGGISEQAVGRSAPWFVLAVMLFSFAVRSVYLESCSMYV